MFKVIWSFSVWSVALFFWPQCLLPFSTDLCCFLHFRCWLARTCWQGQGSLRLTEREKGRGKRRKRWPSESRVHILALLLGTVIISTQCIAQRAYSFFFFFNFYFYFILLYNTILFCPTLTWICHRCTWVPNPEPPSHLPPHIISLDHPRAPAPSILYPVSNIDWRFVSYMIVYMFQCHSPKSSHPLPLPQSPKVCSLHLCLFCCLTYRVIITIFLNSIYMC